MSVKTLYVDKKPAACPICCCAITGSPLNTVFFCNMCGTKIVIGKEEDYVREPIEEIDDFDDLIDDKKENKKESYKVKDVGHNPHIPRYPENDPWFNVDDLTKERSVVELSKKDIRKKKKAEKRKKKSSEKTSPLAAIGVIGCVGIFIGIGMVLYPYLEGIINDYNNNETPDGIKPIGYVESAEAAVDGRRAEMSVNVTYSRMDYNNIGNEWSHYHNFNDREVPRKITVSLGDEITLYSYFCEDDDKPDVGTKTVRHKITEADLKEGFTVTYDVYVKENEGEYKGTAAQFSVVWTFVPD